MRLAEFIYGARITISPDGSPVVHLTPPAFAALVADLEDAFSKVCVLPPAEQKITSEVERVTIGGITYRNQECPPRPPMPTPRPVHPPLKWERTPVGYHTQDLQGRHWCIYSRPSKDGGGYTVALWEGNHPERGSLPTRKQTIAEAKAFVAAMIERG